MSFTSNLIIVCVTCLMITHMITKTFAEISMAKVTGGVVQKHLLELLEDPLKLAELEKIAERSK